MSLMTFLPLISTKCHSWSYTVPFNQNASTHSTSNRHRCYSTRSVPMLHEWPLKNYSWDICNSFLFKYAENIASNIHFEYETCNMTHSEEGKKQTRQTRKLYARMLYFTSVLSKWHFPGREKFLKIKIHSTISSWNFTSKSIISFSYHLTGIHSDKSDLAMQ